MQIKCERNSLETEKIYFCVHNSYGNRLISYAGNRWGQLTSLKGSSWPILVFAHCPPY